MCGNLAILLLDSSYVTNNPSQLTFTSFEIFTPVIVSNATSIPEVCENAAIYFNPFYPEDLFKALFKIIHTRDFYAEQAKMQYKKVEHKQEQDLQNFLKDIIS